MNCQYLRGNKVIFCPFKSQFFLIIKQVSTILFFISTTVQISKITFLQQMTSTLKIIRRISLNKSLKFSYRVAICNSLVTACNWNIFHFCLVRVLYRRLNQLTLCVLYNFITIFLKNYIQFILQDNVLAAPSSVVLKITISKHVIFIFYCL